MINKNKSLNGKQDPYSILEAYIDAAEKMLEDDVADNMNIGKFGSEFIQKVTGLKENITLLTHCNTGSLATAGYGTALVINPNYSLMVYRFRVLFDIFTTPRSSPMYISPKHVHTIKVHVLLHMNSNTTLYHQL